MDCAGQRNGSGDANTEAAAMGNAAPPSGLMVALCLLCVQPRRLRQGRCVENSARNDGQIRNALTGEEDMGW